MDTGTKSDHPIKLKVLTGSLGQYCCYVASLTLNVPMGTIQNCICSRLLMISLVIRNNKLDQFSHRCSISFSSEVSCSTQFDHECSKRDFECSFKTCGRTLLQSRSDLIHGALQNLAGCSSEKAPHLEFKWWWVCCRRGGSTVQRAWGLTPFHTCAWPTSRSSLMAANQCDRSASHQMCRGPRAGSAQVSVVDT